MRNNIIKLRIFLWLLLFWVIAWFLYMGIVPGGEINYSYDFNEKSSFISNFSPEARVLKRDKEYPNFAIGNPVYFNLRTPRSFDEAELKFRYRRVNTREEEEYPLIEAGILTDGKHWRYNLKPLENKKIDKLSLVWDSKRKGDLLLLQNNNKTVSSGNRIYKNIDSFLEDLPPFDKIATYNYDLNYDFILDDYRSFAVEELIDGKEERFLEINQDLRGSYQFYTYIKNEELNFKFSVFDKNENLDEDNIDVLFYFDNHLIASSHLDDDGIISDEGERSGPRDIDLEIPNLPTGAYKIEFKANDDIVTEKIRTKQRKVSFINRLYFENKNENGQKIELFTDSNIVQAKALYVNALQDINAGDQLISLEKTFKQYQAEISSGSKKEDYAKIEFNKGGLILSGNRVFSFSREAFFNPEIKKLDKYINIAGDGIEYVLAKYKIPEEKGDWKEAFLNFDLKNAYSEDGKYGFIISIPGLAAPEKEPIESFGVEFDNLSFKLKGKTLMEKIKK